MSVLISDSTVLHEAPRRSQKRFPFKKKKKVINRKIKGKLGKYSLVLIVLLKMILAGNYSSTAII